MISRYVAFWDRREPPHALALTRMFIAAAMLYDFAWIAWYRLPPLLWADRAHGGVMELGRREVLPQVYRLVAATPETAWGLWAVCVASLLAFGAGLYTRAAGLIFLVVYAQTAMINNQSDRGIDRLVRIMFLALVFSRAGQVWSVDAWRATGRWAGDPDPAPAWPRYLMLGQMVLMYWMAGVSKAAWEWLPLGGSVALYVILQDPTMARMDFGFLAHEPLFTLTRLATFVTHTWEWVFPLLFLAMWYEHTPERPGRLRAWSNRVRLRWWMLGIGVLFHLILAATLELGVFPWATLAFYPVFFTSGEILAALGRARAAVGLAAESAP